MRRFYILRHGEVDENHLGLLVGGGTDSPLNIEGIEAAEKTKAALDRAKITFDKVYASPLRRTARTAEIMAPNRPLVFLNSLKEIDFGEMELSYAPNLVGVEFGKNGVESLEHLQSRVMDAWNYILEDSKNQTSTVLVATHATIIRALLAGLKGSDVMREVGNSNCCATIIDVASDGKVTIVGENICFYDE